MAKSAIKIGVPFGTDKVRQGQFRNNTTVREIKLPSTVRSIEDGAFRGCSSLEKISIPEGVTIIHEYAFSGCTSLVGICLPSTLSYIDEYAFNGCTALEEVVMPDTVSIDYRAFTECPSLKRILMKEIIPEVSQCRRRVAVLIADPKMKWNKTLFGVLVTCQKRDDISEYAVKVIKDLLYMVFKDSAAYLDWEEDRDFGSHEPLSEVLEYDTQRYALVEVPSDAVIGTTTVDSLEYITDADFYHGILASSSPQWKTLA